MTGALAGKVAIITGAGSGIGRASAIRFAAERAKVVLGDMAASVHDTAAMIGDAATAVQMDAGDEAGAEQSFQRSVDLFRDAGAWREAASAGSNLAALGLQRGTHAEAATLAREALGVYRAQRTARDPPKCLGVPAGGASRGGWARPRSPLPSGAIKACTSLNA